MVHKAPQSAKIPQVIPKRPSATADAG